MSGCRSCRSPARAASALLALGYLLCLGAAAAGASPAGPAKGPAAAVDSLASASALRLTGVVTGATLDVLRAIIASPGAGERSYRVGEILPDGSTLAAIDADRVILRRDGSDRVVRLEVFDDVTPAAPPARAAAATHSLSRASSAAHGATPRDLVAAIRANPVLLLDSLPVEAILDRHRMVALRVGKPDDASLMKELKLVPGDVITAINGVELNGPDQGAWMRSATAPAQELALKVYRDGRTETLRY